MAINTHDALDLTAQRPHFLWPTSHGHQIWDPSSSCPGPCSNLFIWGPPGPTSGGDYWSSYGLLVDLSFIFFTGASGNFIKAWLLTFAFLHVCWFLSFDHQAHSHFFYYNTSSDYSLSCYPSLVKPSDFLCNCFFQTTLLKYSSQVWTVCDFSPTVHYIQSFHLDWNHRFVFWSSLTIYLRQCLQFSLKSKIYNPDATVFSTKLGKCLRHNS